MRWASARMPWRMRTSRSSGAARRNSRRRRRITVTPHCARRLDALDQLVTGDISVVVLHLIIAQAANGLVLGFVFVLIAIGLSVGVLVTNSLVVLEAILGRLERLGDPMKAARIGAREVAVAVLASAATNAVVLFPLAAMPTKVGRFIGPLAMTMFWMTVVSLFISFTLTPMLCSRLLKKSFGEKRGLISLAERGFNRGFQAVVSGYRWLLGGLRRRYLAALVVLGAVGLLVHSLWVAQRIGTGAFADPDLGQIFVRLEFPTHYNLQQTAALVRDAERRLRVAGSSTHRVRALLGPRAFDDVVGVVGEGARDDAVRSTVSAPSQKIDGFSAATAGKPRVT